MKPTARETKEFRDLLGLIRDSQIQPEQEERLDQLLGLYPSLQQDYIEYMLLCEALHSYQSLAAQDYSTWPRESFASEPIGWAWEEAFWRAMADYEKTSPAVPVERPAAQRELHPPRRSGPPERRKVKRTPLVVALGLLLGFLVFVVSVSYLQGPAEEAVAVLTDDMDARWSNAADAMKPGGEFFNTDSTRSLLSGFINIQFYRGPRILIEGPAEFKLPDTNRLVLRTGRIYVKVPPQAAGFIVDTPNARVVDLGTEFGIAVGVGGVSDVYMLKGKATLIPGRKSKTGESRLLLTGQALQVNQACEVRDIHFEQSSFVRKISSQTGLVWRGEPLNLADVVGGGNGFGTGLRHDPNTGYGSINPLTGRFNDTWRPYKMEYNPDYYHVDASPRFTPSRDIPYIDGVFVPDGGEMVCIVSSEGHVFAECPDTDGKTKWNINNGWQHAYRGIGAYNTQELLDSPGISMHANCGLTFALDPMRHALPDIEITKFTTRAGMPEHSLPNLGEIDLWILVDGRIRFSKSKIRKGQMFDIQIPLRSDERFLSMVVTDSQTEETKHWSQNDWCHFMRPTLILTQKEITH